MPVQVAAPIPPTAEPVACEASSLDPLLVAAVAARILPSSDGQGAAEAGVGLYLLRCLADDRLAEQRRTVAAGLRLLGAEAQRLHGLPFAGLTAPQQDAVLERVGRFPRLGPAFLGLMVDLVLEGFLCHPSRGGNRGRIGWASLDLAPGLWPDACGEVTPGTDAP
ncbi:MAG: gluconate 2-dehydrogenase subunit 3 family protein [Acidobacteriota bacterium]